MAAGRDDVDLAHRRSRRRAKGLPNWRIVRYADDFVVLVHGTAGTTSKPCAKTSRTCSRRMGLRLSAAKTRVVHMSDGFDFLGFRIQWKRKTGTNKWHVYTFIADRPIRSLKAKIRALTHRTSQQNPGTVLIQAQPDHARLGQLLQARGLQTHPQPPGPLRVVAGGPVAADTAPLDVEGRPPPVHHPRRAVETDHGGRDRTCSTPHRYRSPGTATGATRSPTPGPAQPPPDGSDRGEPGAWRRARRVRRAAWGNGPAATPAPRPRPTQPEKAVVLCVDEKSQVQALDRSQPVLPMMPGVPERRTHDYLRHGVTSLFAAFNIADGTVIGQLHRRHRAIEFRKFLTTVDKAVPADLDVHLICDNYATNLCNGGR